MKLRKVLLMLITCVAVGSTGSLYVMALDDSVSISDSVVNQDEELSENTKAIIDANSISGDQIDPTVIIKSKVKGSTVKIEIDNLSGDYMRNVHLICKDSNRLIPYEMTNNIGEISDGKSITISKTLDSIGHGYIHQMALNVGGTRVLRGLLFAGIIGMCLTFGVLLWRKSDGVWIAGLVLAMTAGGLVIAYRLQCNPEVYAASKVGNNYVRVINLKVEGYEETFYLKYNQDTLEYKTEEKDVEIPFETEYEYDEEKPCTDEQEVLQEGESGLKHVVSTVAYRNGKRSESDDVETVTKEPVAEKVKQGTKTTIEIQNIEAKKSYVPDDTMKVGDFKLNIGVSDVKSNIGKKKVTYRWNKATNKLMESEEVTKEPGTNIWKAGTLVTRVSTQKATTKYDLREDQPVGWTNVISESKDGITTTLYKTEINTETGKPLDLEELQYYATLEEKPVNGETEVGVLSVEDITSPIKEEVTYDDSKWDNVSEIVEQGQSKIERISSVMKFDENTGLVSNEIDHEVSREVVQEAVKQVVVKGTKQPNWVEQKVATDQVMYNTQYVADDSLSGDDQRVVVEGKMGRLVTTQLIAVDDDGNIIPSYDPKVLVQDELIKPTDRVVHVAPDSNLLK